MVVVVRGAEERWDVLLEPRTREGEEVGGVGQQEEERRAARSDLNPAGGAQEVRSCVVTRPGF